MKLSSAFFAFVLFLSMSGSDSTSFPKTVAFAAAAASRDADSANKKKKASTSDNMPIENNGDSDAGGGSSGEIPRLPAVDFNGTGKIPTLKLGETLRLDAMGPIILNADGTTRRIDNWKAMTKHEQDVTWRRIRKRNQERRNKLLEQLKEVDEL